MLETLKIKNIAVIDEAHVNFEPGLNILSGETGAGKSIVIEAISLLLGSRATSDLIRTGENEAVVEGLFSTQEIPWIENRLEDAGIATGDGELLIKRTVSRSGKHRITINGELATLTNLQKICEDLIDLCGQHEHQSLLKPSTQIELLDRYGNLGKETQAFSESFTEYRRLVRERDELLASEAERSRRADFLKFQIQELREANLEAGEDEKLHAEKTLLQTSEARISAAEAARSALENDEGGALQALRTASNKLAVVRSLDVSTENLRAAVERALAEAEDAAMGLNRYLASVDLDPSRLESVQARLSRLAELRRKYGSSAEEMIAQLSALETEYAAIENSDARIAELNAQITKAEKNVRTRAKTLSEKRAKIAKLLAKSVTDELKDLKMGEAKFSIQLAVASDLAEFTTTGADDIQFVVRTNAGETERPLGKIASGGELSRLMLAIRRVIADRGGIGVYLFDEIDAGIGGQTAFEVGKKLRSVASYNQVICITHLPQVAAFAHHHLSVRKETLKEGKDKRTVTTVVELGAKERKEELARMLGGPELTKKSLENAAELLGLARI